MAYAQYKDEEKLFGLNFKFEMKDEAYIVNRNVDTVIVAFTNIGGFMNILFVIVNLLLAPLQRRLFFQSLIRKMYLVKKKKKYHQTGSN